jgi:hypothetical protein
MFGKFDLNLDTDTEPNPGLQLTSSEPNRSSNQTPEQAQTYIDQLPLNWSSQSSQYAPTLTSADSASMRNDPELLYQHGERSTEDNCDNQKNDDRKSMISTYSYRSDVNAYRFLREVEGRVSVIPAHELCLTLFSLGTCYAYSRN